MKDYIGAALERLSLAEQRRLAGKWAAFEVYTPETVPLRKVAALEASMDACVQALQKRGLDPRNFEFRLLSSPVA